MGIKRLPVGVVKILATLILVSCSGTHYRAPVANLAQPPSQKITTHTVAKGETLYSIAWRYDLEVRALARANRIPEPYTIHPGQQISLDLSKTPAPVAVARVRKDAKTPPASAVSSRSNSQASAPKAGAKIPAASSPLKWRWPVNGTILAHFSGARALNKGIDIGAEKGEPVFAAEDGTVVYAGNGLRGYGNLLIIKHNENYLSAYAHNNKLLVAEGDVVSAGKQIAEVGSSGTNTNKLHFEIRRDGIPVDPLRYLPPRR